MSQTDIDPSFFERERDKISGEITNVVHFSVQKSTFLSVLQGFEELLRSANVLNRKLEEVLGMTREYETIASLWKSFHELMRGQNPGDVTEDELQSPGLPGTGGHTLTK